MFETSALGNCNGQAEKIAVSYQLSAEPSSLLSETEAANDDGI